MRDKLKSNLLDNSRTEKRPPSQKPEIKQDEDDYSNGSFEQDDNDAGNGED